MDFAVGVSPVDLQVPPPQERTAGSPKRVGSWTFGVVGLMQTQQEGTAASACEQLRDESQSNRKASQSQTRFAMPIFQKFNRKRRLRLS